MTIAQSRRLFLLPADASRSCYENSFVVVDEPKAARLADGQSIYLARV